MIAIENVRLFNEVQAKTRDLTEALTYQTGSGNILSVIASRRPMSSRCLKAIVESACELCDADDAAVLPEGRRRSCASARITVRYRSVSRNGRSAVSWTAGRAFIDRKPVHVRDLLSDEGDDFPDGQRIGASHGPPHHPERAAAARRTRASASSRSAAPKCSRSATSRSPCCRPSPTRP